MAGRVGAAYGDTDGGSDRAVHRNPANQSTRVGSLSLEGGRPSRSQSHNPKEPSWGRTMSLAFQSIGVIYGDIGTSPLYVYSSTFTDGIQNTEDILGVLSLIIYTIILLPMLKYVFIVLRANDNGDGGTFALYSLLCRHAKVSMIPNQQPEDAQLSNYRSPETPPKPSKVKEKLENSKVAQLVLFVVTILGTSMVIGDGVLTPSMSVLSAVGGISSLGTDTVMWISVGILIALFLFQRFGTDKVGFTFAPVISIWFLFITGIGLYNLFKYDVRVLRAFYPKYIFDYFKRNGKQGWVSLGGIVLCITGIEAMFADLGHFNVRAIQIWIRPVMEPIMFSFQLNCWNAISNLVIISFSTMVAPAILAAYIGQGAYLTKFPDQVSNTFYASVPGRVYWPMFIVAIGAAVIASQAMISGAYAIISQSLALGCFPRVKVIHTSTKYEGQVYIPEINYILMVASVAVTLGFKTTTQIGNAYGIAVVFVMTITTCMVTLIMLVVWKTSIWKIVIFFSAFGLIELLYLSSVLFKFKQGGWLPLLFALVLMTIMAIWYYVYRQWYIYELQNKVSVDYVKTLVKNSDINRVPGIGLLYSELVQGIPPIFSHFIKNISSVHSVLIFVSIKAIPISRVALEERFVFRYIESRDYRMFRCVVRYGYKDINEEPAEFERQLFEGLADFIQREHSMLDGEPNEARDEAVGIHQSAEEEVQFVQTERQRGVVYLLGETKVVAKRDSMLLKKVVVDYAYDFLRKNFRQGEEVMKIPHGRLLRVGMTYEI